MLFWELGFEPDLVYDRPVPKLGPAPGRGWVQTTLQEMPCPLAEWSAQKFGSSSLSQLPPSRSWPHWCDMVHDVVGACLVNSGRPHPSPSSPTVGLPVSLCFNRCDMLLVRSSDGRIREVLVEIAPANVGIDVGTKVVPRRLDDHTSLTDVGH
ncbi:hypothetical protein FA95DRAFT_584199 [Auriscalpium vulgare]|uniref:Uncharacterized protein n=1 Tax=Auriscalpium vulgare TaxID=40419 RepID=A0ACB8RFI6_9AGAM|nr:hypothetical protein FA95DRAFT_584199 [Auriscalpium vulgare]